MGCLRLLRPLLKWLSHHWSMDPMTRVNLTNSSLKLWMLGETLERERLILMREALQSKVLLRKSHGEKRIRWNNLRTLNREPLSHLNNPHTTLPAHSQSEPQALRKRSHQQKSPAGTATNFTFQTRLLPPWKTAKSATVQISAKRNTISKTLSLACTKNAVRLS